MMNLKSYFWIVAISLFVVSCKKENNKNWLVADIHVTDAINGEPISNCKASLCYIQYTLFGSYYEYPIELGSTDENGYLHVEWERPNKSKNFKINLFPPGNYAHPYAYTMSNCETSTGISVSPGKLNIVEKSYTPYALFRFHYINQSCFDGNDSLILKTTMTGGSMDEAHLTQKLIGCVDTLIPYPEYENSGFVWTQHTELLLEKRIYKNGSDTTIYKTVNLNSDGEIQVIEIDY